MEESLALVEAKLNKFSYRNTIMINGYLPKFIKIVSNDKRKYSLFMKQVFNETKKKDVILSSHFPNPIFVDDKIRDSLFSLFDLTDRQSIGAFKRSVLESSISELDGKESGRSSRTKGGTEAYNIEWVLYAMLISAMIQSKKPVKEICEVLYLFNLRLYVASCYPKYFYLGSNTMVRGIYDHMYNNKLTASFLLKSFNSWSLILRYQPTKYLFGKALSQEDFVSGKVFRGLRTDKKESNALNLLSDPKDDTIFREFVTAMISRLNSTCKNIRSKYEESKSEGGFVNSLSDHEDGEGNVLYSSEMGNDGSIIFNEVNKVVNHIGSNSVKMEDLKKSVEFSIRRPDGSTFRNLSDTNITVAAEAMIVDIQNDTKDLKDIIFSILKYYYSTNNGTLNIKSRKFFFSSIEIISKPQSDNKYVNKIKDILNKYIDRYIKEYNMHKLNDNTRIVYRKVLYVYLIFSIYNS